MLEQSGIVRSDIRSSFGDYSGTAEGVPMTLELVVSDLANGGVPFEGAAVYVWHCTREGGYSLYSDGVEDQNFLRGVQIADADGRVTFTSIFPACYDGRWPHIHFEVYPDQAAIADSTSAIATSQVALPQDVCEQVYAEDGYESSVSNLSRVSLESDNVFGDDGGASQLGTVTGDVASGYTVTLAVGVDTTTAPTGRRRPGRTWRPAEPADVMSLGPVEIGLIVLAVMLLFGYRKLPDASRSLGTSLRIFKSEVGGVHAEARDDGAPRPSRAPPTAGPEPSSGAAGS